MFFSDDRIGRGVVENTAVFALKSQKHQLERENSKIKQDLETAKQKNQFIALEKYELE